MPDYDEGWGRESSTEGISCAKCGRVYQPTNSCEPCPFCEVATLKAQRDAFEAIVATLPKCNRLVDGELVCDRPVTPGMEVWFWNGFPDCAIGEPEKVTAIILDADDTGEWLINDGSLASHFYDSREAAEAAKGKSGA